MLIFTSKDPTKHTEYQFKNKLSCSFSIIVSLKYKMAANQESLECNVITK